MKHGGETYIRLRRGSDEYHEAGGDKIVKAFMEELLPQYPNCNITTIELSRLRITDLGAEVLGMSIPSIPPLECSLLLGCNEIRASGARAIAIGPSQSQSALGYISLNGNESIGLEGIKAFAEHNPPFLRSRLSLWNTGIGDEGMPLASLLGNSKTLEELDLGFNDITDTWPIADALSINSVLRKLDLANNDMITSNLRGVEKALFHSTRMKEPLDLSANEMTDDAAGSLMTALSHNGTVECLQVDNIP